MEKPLKDPSEFRDISNKVEVALQKCAQIFNLPDKALLLLRAAIKIEKEKFFLILQGDALKLYLAARNKNLIRRLPVETKGKKSNPSRKLLEELVSKKVLLSDFMIALDVDLDSVTTINRSPNCLSIEILKQGLVV